MEIPRELYATLTNLWNDLEPENVEVLENLLMLPALQRIDVLPYLAVDSNPALYVKDIPLHVRAAQQPAMSPDDIAQCFLCEKEVGVEPCGFCGRYGCVTVLLKQGKKLIVKSSCPYRLKNMSMKRVLKITKNEPCTNGPINCLIDIPGCPFTVSGILRTIWRYNTVYPFITLHPDKDGNPPRVPLQMVVASFIRRLEESLMNVDAALTSQYREDQDIPESDGLQGDDDHDNSPPPELGKDTGDSRRDLPQRERGETVTSRNFRGSERAAQDKRMRIEGRK